MMCFLLSFAYSVLQAEDMVAEIKGAFEDSLKHVSWMDPETKKAAKEKVSERVFVYFLKRNIPTPALRRHVKCFFTEVNEICSTATWCRNLSFTVFSNLIFHRQMQYTTWLDIQSSL